MKNRKWGKAPGQITASRQSASIANSQDKKRTSIDTTMSSPVGVRKSSRRFRVLSLTASFVILFVIQTSHTVLRKKNTFVAKDNNNTAKEVSVGLEDAVSASGPSSNNSISGAVSVEDIDKNLKQSGIPIYLSDSSSGSVSSVDYRFLASVWDRNTTYEGILLRAASKNDTATSSTAAEDLRRKLGDKNITVIFHTSPKTGENPPLTFCSLADVKVRPTSAAKLWLNLRLQIGVCTFDIVEGIILFFYFITLSNAGPTICNIPTTQNT